MQLFISLKSSTAKDFSVLNYISNTNFDEKSQANTKITVYTNLCTTIGTCPVSDDFFESKYQIVGFQKGFPAIRQYFNVIDHRLLL